jgi:hypothetical protein
MLKQRTRIDDAVFTYFRTDIDDSAVHHDGARANASVSGHMSGRRNDGRQLKSQFGSLPIEVNAAVWRTNLAHRNKCKLILFS